MPSSSEKGFSLLCLELDMLLVSNHLSPRSRPAVPWTALGKEAGVSLHRTLHLGCALTVRGGLRGPSFAGRWALHLELV